MSRYPFPPFFEAAQKRKHYQVQTCTIWRLLPLPTQRTRPFNLISLLIEILSCFFMPRMHFLSKILKYRTLTRFWPPPTPFLAPLNQGRLLVYGRNGQSICLLSPFFCPSSKIAQPKYAKGASERARSASVYGTLVSISNHLFDFIASLDLESHAYFEVGRKIQRPLFIVGGWCRRLRSPNPDRSLNPDHAVL